MFGASKGLEKLCAKVCGCESVLKSRVKLGGSRLTRVVGVGRMEQVSEERTHELREKLGTPRFEATGSSMLG
jgi:hypothetical protein